MELRSFIIILSGSAFEMQVLFPLLKVCQALPTPSHPNFPKRIVRRLEDALTLASRKETDLKINVTSYSSSWDDMRMSSKNRQSRLNTKSILRRS